MRWALGNGDSSRRDLVVVSWHLISRQNNPIWKVLPGAGARGWAQVGSLAPPFQLWLVDHSQKELVRNFPTKHFSVRRCHFTKGETFAETH